MILSIDLGSTNFKAALFDLSLKRLGSYSLHTPYSHNEEGCVEMDVPTVRMVLIKLIKGTCRIAEVEPRSITSVAVTSQARCFTLLDESGNALCPLISWLDGRAGKEARELGTAMDMDWNYHCGLPALHGQTTLAKMLWISRNMPEVLNDGVQYVTLPGLVFHLLAGVNLTDATQEAMNGMYSLADQVWLRGALAYCGLNKIKLPQCLRAGTSVVVHPRCNELDMQDEVFFVPAGNDQIAGAFGSGCREGEVVVTLGTALAALRIVGSQPGPYHAVGFWGSYPDGKYYEAAVSSTGCRAVDWARDVLMPGEDIESFDVAIEQAVSSVTETTGTFRPELMKSPDAWQGTFSGNREKAYAVLEGLVFDLRKLVFNALARPRGITLRVTGGGSRSDIFLQMIADGLGCTVSSSAGDSLLGAAAMAAGRDVPDADRRFFYPAFSRRIFFKLRRRKRSGNHRGFRHLLIQKLYLLAYRICSAPMRFKQFRNGT